MKRKTIFSCSSYCLKLVMIISVILGFQSSFGQQWNIIGNESQIASAASSASTIAIVKNGANFTPYVAFTEGGIPKVKQRLTDGTWEQVGPDLGTSASYTRIFSDAGGNLYVAYIDQSAGSKLAVKKYDYIAGTWDALNPDDPNSLYVSNSNVNVVSSKFSGQRYSMAFDSFNNLYIAFSDSDYMAYVKKFNGTSWETLGAGAVSAIPAALPNLAIDATDKPFLVYTAITDGTSTTGSLTLFSFNGTVWNEIVNPTAIGGVRQICLANNGNNSLCMAMFDTSNSNRTTIVQYDKVNNLWSGKTSLSAKDGQYITLINDPAGNVYCSHIDKAASSTYDQVAKVHFLVAGETAWTEMKDPLVSRGIDEPTNNLSIAIGSSDVPYIAYTKSNSSGVTTPIVRQYAPPPPPVSLTTNNISEVATTTVVAGGNITADGGVAVTERGVVYSNSNANPTIIDAKVSDVAGGIGTYSVTLSGLLPGTFYYTRAYAINGNTASYGNVVRVSTLQLPDATVNTPKQMEYLSRGLVAIQKTATSVFLSWRLLGTDPKSVGFNVYRNGVKVTSSPITTTTNYTDNTSSSNNNYSVTSVVDGVESEQSAAVTVWALNTYKTDGHHNKLYIPLQIPPDGTLPDGRTYSYTANDCSVGDVDGDGTYEVFLKWDPTIVNDNAGGYSGKQIFDCYKLDGTRLWRIDLGINVNAGPHYSQFMVYDFDGDGKAEMFLKTADGTVDGKGVVIGNSAVDYRNTNGWVQNGPEFLTVFNGLTGAAMATVDFQPARGNVSDWGDNYGNRQDRFVSAVAYLDGARPSLIVGRGYYNKLVRAAYDWRNGQISLRWIFDSKDPTHPEYNSYSGQGNHQMTIGDVDGDGKDEVINGSSVINDDGKPLWTYGMGHGDALHMTDMDIDRPGQEIWINLESPSSYAPMGLRQYDAKTGRTNWGIETGGDVGRSMAADMDPYYRGYEMWGSSGDAVYDVKGNPISVNKPSYNFGIWWDGDLGRELFDRSYIDKWNSGTKSAGRLYTIYQDYPVSTNNSTKSTPCLQADILGDWREELILRKSDNTELVIFTTDTPTNYRIPTLMHDPQYRTAIAWQNSGYNQPPYPSYYIGYDMDVNNIPTAKIEIAGHSSLTVSAISRKNPAAAKTNSATVTYQVDFSANVTGVDASDFTLTATGTATGSIAAIIATSASSYEVTINNISGEGTVRLDLKDSGTNITDESSNAIEGSFTKGDIYTIDRSAPSLTAVTLSSNNSTPTLAKAGDLVTLNFTANESLTGIAVSIAGNVVTATDQGSNTYNASYLLTNSDAEGIIPFTIEFSDLAGNAGAAVSSATDGKTVTLDSTAPTLSNVTMTSSNVNTGIAKEGDVVTLNFTASEAIGNPTVAIAGHNVTATNVSATTYSASYTLVTADAEGTIAITIDFADLAGNAATQVTAAANSVNFQHTTPILKVYVETPSCPGSANGKISVATNMDGFTYTIAISGPGVNQTLTNQTISTSTSWQKTNLAAGSYQVTIAIPSVSFTQDYLVKVNELSAITAKRTATDKVVSYTVSGSNEYTVTVNGVSRTYITANSDNGKIEIDSSLLQADNTITIASENDCQGVIEDSFSMSPSILIHPNPTADIVYIEGVEKGLIQVYTNNGTLALEKDAAITKSIDLSGYSAGVYLVKITQETETQTFKVILK